MPATAARTVFTPRLALAAQALVLALVVAAAEFAPRPGLAALYLPVMPSHDHAALDWALAHGAAINGKGPFGGLILTAVPPGFGLEALREGALALSLPSSRPCQPPKDPSHG